MALNLLLFLMRRRTLAASALAVRAPGPTAFAALPALPEWPRAACCAFGLPRKAAGSGWAGSRARRAFTGWRPSWPGLWLMKRAMPPAPRSGACWPARLPGRKKRLLPEFWLAVQAQGAPLLEESRRRKARSPRCAACRARMSGHLSLPLPRGLRMACQLVIDPVQWPASGPHTRLQQVLAAGLSVQLDPLNPRAWHAGSADAAPAAPP
jgi:hypothetical protein